MKIRESGTSPYPYWTFENLIHASTAQDIFEELQSLSHDADYISRMYKYDNVFERKFAQDNWDLLPPITKAWLCWTLTAPFIAMIETITGIQGLIADPWLRGGGFHLHKPGGVLMVHKDFTMHPKLKLIRRLNLIVYMNKNYDPSWGGQLELWSKNMEKCEVKIDPGYNMGVLFETPEAPHGFNTPWSAPIGIGRKSLAVYLYSAPTEEDLRKTHLSTQFLRSKDEQTTDGIEALRERRNHGRLTSG